MERHFTNYPVFGPDADLIDPEELPTWVIENNDDLLAFDKPGWVVCHPSKNGPWSSLVGACREWTGMETLHLIARLDRETSGVILLAKHKAAARKLQIAFQDRAVEKTYHAILEGEMAEPVAVDQRLAKDLESPVAAKVTVRRSNSSQRAISHFTPLVAQNGYTLAEVKLETGRKHQIRAHAEWLGHRVVGDKIYGPDSTLFLDFIEHGWTERLEANLAMRRQALHCTELRFSDGLTFRAPLAWDMRQFARERMGLADLPAACVGN
ncbi:RluA family pseudouridine synthase [Cerasicoccus maritimus]|uniref:RluA family pseudouridine synthase n=1 Tax=Cerasicoccus maritimus TaxID=490089 RepID=UPI00285273DA|nr:RluA family pseudouridine synthase [Cerasicoccus maritimus]